MLLATTVGVCALALPAVEARAAGPTTAQIRALVESERQRFDIPGVALAVVQGGEVTALEGFGVSDRESGEPVDAASTVFSIASVSKPVTALAIHQLAEDGALDLGAGVGELTGIDLPGPGPVPLGSLLTHTAGFEDRKIGYLSLDPGSIEPLADYVPAHVPDRFAPAGVVHSYTNYDYALAGYAAEVATGQAFETLMQDRLLRPLGMSATTFTQAAPTGLARGYTGQAGAREPAPPVYERQFPAGGAFTTAADMARLLQALTGHRTQVVPPAVLDGYLAPAYRPHPDLPGRTGGGLVERWWRGTRVVGHGGDIGAFSAELVLVPSQDTGFFFAANTVDAEFSNRLLDGLLDLLTTPTPTQPPAFTDLPESELARYAGAYRWTRFSRSTVDKVIAMTPTYNTFVAAPGDGTMVVTWLGVEEQWVYRPLRGGAFIKVSGGPALVDGILLDPGERIALTRNTAGEVNYLHLSLQTVALEKVPLPLIGVVQITTVGSIVLAYLLALPGWAVGAAIQRRRRAPKPRGHLIRLLAIAQTLVATAALGFLFAGTSGVQFGITTAALISISAFTTTAILGLALLPAAVVAWARGRLTLGERIQLSLLALVSPILTWWTIYWNLFGLHL